jgi:sugar fermentation stimulation protein A
MELKNLIKGKLIRRYKRFLVDIELMNKEIITAHCPNSGSMKSLIDKGNIVYLSYNNDPKRKLNHSLELIKLKNNTLACVNTMLPNRIVYDAIVKGKIKEIKKYSTIKREVKYGKENSKIDILLENKDEKIYVEVKNVTLMEEDFPKIAQFPDAVTLRGQKHLRELSLEVKKGNKAMIVYLINRSDCDSFRIAKHIDSNYYEEYLKATKSGVKAVYYKTLIKVDKNNNAIIEIV